MSRKSTWKNWFIKFENGTSISISAGEGMHNTGNPGNCVTSVEILRSTRDEAEGWMDLERLLDALADLSGGTITKR